MSADYAAKERAFLDSLKADTGRDLAEWMQAIGDARLPHRNDTIDWLRQHGFPFSRASWLERIHHNGGRPIYADAGPRPAATRRASTRPKGTPSAATRTPATVAAAATPDVAPADPASRTPAPASGRPGTVTAQVDAAPGAAGIAAIDARVLDKAAVAALLAPAKAYRPLAQYLIAAIERALPSVHMRAADGLVMLCDPHPFAAILPGARDIRLGLDAGDAALGRHLLRARLPGCPPELPHTVVLDDARQVNPELIAVVEAAWRRTAARAA